MNDSTSKLSKQHLFVSYDNRKIVVNYDIIKRASLALRAINHPLRRQLLESIDYEKEMGVTELYKKLRIEQSVCSQHLGILRKAKVVTTERKGREIHYSINSKRIIKIKNIAQELAQKSV